jgi:hypothetical protein
VTTDLARMDTAAVAVLTNTSDALVRLGEWVEAARHAHQLVGPLVDTAFVPEAYKPKVDPRATPEQKAEARQIAVNNATAAVLQGITLGLDPMTALQQIYIVHGRPGMYAKLMVALVQAHGHEVWTEDLTDTRAVVCGRRKGTDYTERVAVSMDQARKAGWTSNQAYTKTPQDMLWSRAAARVCDRIASDVLKGIASVEEIRDTVQATAETGGNGRRTVSPPRRPTPAAIEATVEEEPPLEDPVPAETPKPITAAQQRKLHALLRDKDMADREVALVWMAGEIDRELTSTKDLTLAEAGAIIDALEAMVPAQDEPTLDADWPDAAQPPDGAS